MLDRIVVNVIDVPREIGFVANQVSRSGAAIASILAAEDAGRRRRRFIVDNHSIRMESRNT